MSRGAEAAARSGRIVVALCICLVSGLGSRTVQAGNPALNTQTFRPPAFPNDVFGVRGADLPPHLTASGALVFGYARRPLVFVEDVEGGRSHAVVDHQVTMDLLASFSFFDRAGIGLALPLFLFQRGEDRGFVPIASYSSFAVGDLRISPVVVLLPHRGRGVGVALDLTFSVPTAQGGRFASDRGVTFSPTVAVEVAYEPIRVALELGYRVREDVRMGPIVAGDQILMGLSVAVPVGPEGFELLADLQLATAAERPFGSAVDNQLEARLGAGHRFPFGLGVRAGVGAGLLDGWGTPSFRVFVQVGYDALMGGRDPDGDGLVGDDDHCPDEAEDEDGFDDHDGCPELDNDGDGIPDDRDRCPLLEEDFDGFQDDDGCPEADNDGDGIPDPKDACPNDAEDMDNYEDDDGCPDVDNDGDGFPDASDRCPDEAETPNGYQDDDGCADTLPVAREADRLVLAEKIAFVDPERTEVDPSSLEILRALAGFLESHPEISLVQVEAHTDSVGGYDQNMRRSQRQAAAVVRVLVELGVFPERLKAAGFGESSPIAPNTDEEGREENRRIDFVIVEHYEI